MVATSHTKPHLSFPTALWKAFTTPLSNNEDRYINLVTLQFGKKEDVTKDEGQDIFEITESDLVDKDTDGWDVRQRVIIIEWLIRYNQNVSDFYTTPSMPPATLRRKSDFYYKGNPWYASVRDDIIDGIINGNAVYTREMEARNALNEVRSKYTCKRLENGEDRDLLEYLFIRGYDLTEDDVGRGLVGNYARLFIEERHSMFLLKIENASHFGWDHPLRNALIANQGKDAPNWGQRTFKELKKHGKMYFPSLEKAHEELQRISEYKTAIASVTGKVRVMVVRRDPKKSDGTKSKYHFDRIEIRLGIDNNDRPYLYMTYQPPPKPYFSPPSPSPAPSSKDLRLLFNIDGELPLRVASFFMDEVSKREGRRRFKTNSVSETDIIYHFTSHANMNAIISSNEIWMSDIRTMNDMTERNYGCETLVDFISSFKHSTPDRITLDEWSIHMLDTITHSITGDINKLAFFASSFTDQRDNAQHWVNYGRKGEGVALGFDRKALERAASKAGIHLRKTLYIPDRQTEIISSILERILQDSLIKTIDPSEVGRVFSTIFSRIDPIFKHKSFGTEFEWRLFTSSPSYDSKWIEKERARDASDLLIGYIIARFKSAEDDAGSEIPVAIKDILPVIVVGHSGNTRDRVANLEGFLRRREFTKTRVEVSDVPIGTY